LKNPLDMTGRTVLVTGASSGIGKSTSVLLSELGASVILVGRNEARLGETARLLGGRPHRLEVFDLANLEVLAAWFHRVVSEVGPLHGVAHCAGIDAFLPLRSLTISRIDEVLRTNLHSAILLTQALARKSAYHPGASIVLVSSVAGSVGVPARSAYSASKGALIAFARSAALELARNGIRVNCVAPSYVKTEMYERAVENLTLEQQSELIGKSQPLGLGTPLDVAHSIAFLLADTGRWITGTVLTVDGGYSAQ
jgi:NAD(P)-dependent dehydrogenase (short-subunit alcohol dehydrogenase family)